MIAGTRADAIAALVSAELCRQRDRLNADGEVHSLHIHVMLSDRTGRPYKIRMNLETEQAI